MGGLGDLACFSFYFSKNRGAYGESGAVVTSDPELARRVRLFRDHGSEKRYHHEEFGFNSRMDEIHAAVLRVKLRHLSTWNTQRRSHAASYDLLLAGADLALPVTAPDHTHVYYVYVIRSAKRDLLQRELAAHDIGTGVHFPIPAHLQPATARFGYHLGDLPRTEAAAREVLSIPMYPELTKDQLEWVASAVRSTLQTEASVRA